MEQWNCIMEQWDNGNEINGTMGQWDNGTMEQWNNRTMEKWKTEKSKIVTL